MKVDTGLRAAFGIINAMSPMNKSSAKPATRRATSTKVYIACSGFTPSHELKKVSRMNLTNDYCLSNNMTCAYIFDLPSTLGHF